MCVGKGLCVERKKIVNRVLVFREVWCRFVVLCFSYLCKKKKKKKHGTCNNLADTSLGFLVAGGGAGARSSRSRGNFGNDDGGGRDGGALWASHFLAYKKVPTMRRPILPGVDVGALLNSLANKQGRKYSLDLVKMSLEAILEQGVSTTQASEMYGINRSTLQFYLKKLNVVRRRWRQPPSTVPVQQRHA